MNFILKPTKDVSWAQLNIENWGFFAEIVNEFYASACIEIYNKPTNLPQLFDNSGSKT